MWPNFKRSNIHVIRITEAEDKIVWVEKLFKEIQVENSLRFG